MAIKQVKVRGVKRWQARIAYQGQRLSRLCESKEAAKQAEAELLRSLVKATEEDTQAEAAPATLALLCDAYTLDLEARGKSAESIDRVRETKAALSAFFGQRMQAPITAPCEADLYAFRAHLLQRRHKPNYINRHLTNLRAMLKRVFPGFRFPGGLFFKPDLTRVRWLEPDQEALVMTQLASPFREMAKLAALTLMRLTEIRTLRREQVSLSQGVIQLPKTKEGPGTVVLSAEAQGILQAQLDSHGSEWVFPASHGGPYGRDYPSQVWREAARAAGLSDFHFHDLRHHGATMALNAGYSTPIVMALGRWGTEKMMRRYAAVTDKTLRAAAEAVSGNLRPAMATGTGNGVANHAKNMEIAAT